MLDLERSPDELRAERERELAVEIERRRPSQWWSDWSFALYRFVVRPGRVLVGLCVAAIALWLFSIALDALGTPFAKLSPLGLLGGVLAALGGMLVSLVAFGVAFGEGQSRGDFDAKREEKLRERARRRLDQRQLRMAVQSVERTIRERLEAKSLQESYGTGRTLGRLIARLTRRRRELL
jgi:hypothetical protein